MQLQLQSFTTLVQNMAASVQSSAATLIDLTTGSVLRAILEANASLALWLQWLIVEVLSQTRAATSNGSDLDSWVGDFGLIRLPAQAAATTLTFSRINAGLAATVPVGAQVKTSDGLQTFGVTLDPTNPSYTASSSGYYLAPSVSSVTVPAQALAAGSAGNVQAGAISLLASAIPGVDSVTNVNTAAGGMNAESDLALRSRFTNFIDSRSRATPEAIAFTIQSLQQGLSYQLFENTDPSGAIRYGFYTVVIDDGSGSPPASLLASVSAVLDTVRPVGTQFAVQPPNLLVANIALTLTPSGASQPPVQAAVMSAIEAYVSTLPIGASLPISRLSAIAYATSTTIMNVNAISINGGPDLTPPASGIIKPGTITVS